MKIPIYKDGKKIEEIRFKIMSSRKYVPSCEYCPGPHQMCKSLMIPADELYKRKDAISSGKVQLCELCVSAVRGKEDLLEYMPRENKAVDIIDRSYSTGYFMVPWPGEVERLSNNENKTTSRNN